MRKLYRSKYDKKIAGVCGGLGNYLSVDPVLIRLLVIFLMTLTLVFPVVIIYVLASVILPLEPPNSPAIHFKRLYRAKNDCMIAGICGGLAKIFRLDSSVMRLIIIGITFITGLVPMIVAYLVGWAIIPEKNL